MQLNSVIARQLKAQDRSRSSEVPMTGKPAVCVSRADLLPPIFDQIVTHLKGEPPTSQTRADLAATLLATIKQAAALSIRLTMRGQDSTVECVTLRTADRLSGGGLSRERLVQQIRGTVPHLPREMVELALLLIEAHLDLALVQSAVELGGVSIAHDAEGLEPAGADAVSWCQTVLPSVLLGVSGDRPTVWSRIVRRQSEAVRILVQGLQLSATLRRALPYRIQMRRDELEELLEDRRERESIRVLHLSDLHLGPDLTAPGHTKLRPARVPTHDPDTANALARTVRDLSPGIDLLLGTGDLTTDGAVKSFERVEQYLRWDAILEPNGMRTAMFGLNVGRKRQLLVPGNHDRYANRALPGQRSDWRFEDSLLGERPMYPYVVGVQPGQQGAEEDATPGAPGAEPSRLTLIFFVFDSTLTHPNADLNALARGEINANDLAEFRQKARQLADRREVGRLGGGMLRFNPQRTVRIAVLHHHPIQAGPKANSRQGGAWSVGRILRKMRSMWGTAEEHLMAMGEPDAFLASCLTLGIQIVLFGHRHEHFFRCAAVKDAATTEHGEERIREVETPFGQRPAVVYCFCCPSALEYDADENGFSVFDFKDERTVSEQLYLARRVHGRSQPFEPQAPRDFDLLDPEPDLAQVKWVTVPGEGVPVAAS